MFDMSDKSIYYYDLTKGEYPPSFVWVGSKVLTDAGYGMVVNATLKNLQWTLKVELESGHFTRVDLNGKEV